MMTTEPVKTKAGEILFIAVFFIFSAFLLSQLGDQAKFNPKGKFFAQPAVWPGIGVIGMTLFGGLHLLTRYKHRIGGTLGELITWIRAFEFVMWFMVYVYAVPLIGYLPCTIVFTIALALRMGYRKGMTLFWAGFAGLVIVVVFKTLLQVKIPGAAAYEYLPDALRNFMIVYF
jgi:hypothetical protein